MLLGLVDSQESKLSRSKENSTVRQKNRLTESGKGCRAYCLLLFRVSGHGEFARKRGSEVKPKWRSGQDRSIVGGKVSGIKKRRQKMRPGERTQQGVWLWHHVTPACSRGCWVLRFLKGPEWCLWAKTESVWAQHGSGVTTQHDSNQPGLTGLHICVCVCVLHWHRTVR